MDRHDFRSLKGMRVLVVDDNSILRRLAHHVLLQWQVSTDLASNGRVALEMVSKDTYDVVLMDLMMPELDGYEATRAIRSMEGAYFRNLPIFAFSASPDPQRVMESNMNGLICKTPIDKEELYQKISPYYK
jgi:CheY-like chemotaxis protein